MSIGSVVLARLKGQKLPHARWSLGRYGLGINIAAVMYSLWAFFWSFWPNSYQPTATSMNYAVVLFGGFIAMSTVLYYVHARHVYDGPVAKVQRF